MTVITASPTGGAWNTNAAWVGSVQPTAADDVLLAATSGAMSIPTGTTALCRSLDCSGGGASNFTSSLTFASTTAVLSVGDAGGGMLKFVGTMSLVLTGIGTISFVSTTASTTYQLTTAGLTMPNLTVNTGATTTIQFADNVTCAVLTQTAGKWDSNSKTVAMTRYVGNAGSLTLGSSALSTSASQGWNLNGPTLTAGTSTLTVNSGGSFLDNGQTYSTVVMAAIDQFGTSFNASTTTFGTLTLLGTANKAALLMLPNKIGSVTGTLTITGQSVMNRLLVQSSVIGTARTITAGAVVLTNCDLMDISGLGAATWSGTSLGDCQGNSGITFTTPATQTHTASAGGSWSDVTKWTSRVPLPQDNVIVDVNTTGTLTLDMPRVGKDITFTGFAGTLTVSALNFSMFGSLTLGSGMTTNITASTITVGGRGSHTITSAGITLGSTAALTVNGPGGTYTLQDALSLTGRLTISGGTLTTNNMAVTVSTNSALIVINAGAFANFGTSTITTIGSGIAAPIQMNASPGNLSAALSTIVVSGASASSRTFSGGGATYGTLIYTVANSPGPLVITGVNTFGTLNIGSGRVVTFPSSTVTTMNNLSATGVSNGYFVVPGVASNYASTPDAAPLDITGDITIDVKIALASWSAPAANVQLLTKYGNTLLTDCYLLNIASGTGRPGFTMGVAGTSQVTATSTATPSFGAGVTGWLRVTRQQSSGTVQFYSSTDGVIWTQLGSNVILSAGTAMNTTAQQVEFGSYANGSGVSTLFNLYEARIYNGYRGVGTPVFDANFATKPFGANTFTESSSNAATVTINGSMAQAGDGRIIVNSSTPGTPATVKCARGPTYIDYGSVTDITNTGEPVYACQSTNGGGNTAVTFLDQSGHGPIPAPFLR